MLHLTFIHPINVNNNITCLLSSSINNKERCRKCLIISSRWNICNTDCFLDTSGLNADQAGLLCPSDPFGPCFYMILWDYFKTKVEIPPCDLIKNVFNYGELNKWQCHFVYSYVHTYAEFEYFVEYANLVPRITICKVRSCAKSDNVSNLTLCRCRVWLWCIEFAPFII